MTDLRAGSCHRLDLRPALPLSFDLVTAFFTDAFRAWMGERSRSPGMARSPAGALDLPLR